MLDANANRSREALRVMEDYTRFALNDEILSTELKHIRHALGTILHALNIEDAMLSRDTPNDVGTTIKTESELHRESLGSIVTAAGKRLSESLRVLEEAAKTIRPALATQLEQLRYRGYTVEKTLGAITGGDDLKKKFSEVRLYILLTESLCHPSAGGWEKVLDQILYKAGDGIAGFSLCVQLREKQLSDAELLRRAKVVAAKCREHHALSIINDRPDIALLANADGVHLGQGDLPCSEARKILGHGKIIGVSTENLEQARAALHAGATYIACGPMFPTTTKEKPRIAGPQYASQAQKEIPLPIVAIGGITPDNLSQLTTLKIPRVAICSAIISAAKPAAATLAFLEKLRSDPIIRTPTN